MDQCDLAWSGLGVDRVGDETVEDSGSVYGRALEHEIQLETFRLGELGEFRGVEPIEPVFGQQEARELVVIDGIL